MKIAIFRYQIDLMMFIRYEDDINEIIKTAQFYLLEDASKIFNLDKKYNICFKKEYYDDFKIQEEMDTKYYYNCDNLLYRWGKQLLTRHEWLSRMHRLKPFNLILEIETKDEYKIIISEGKIQ